MSPVTCFWVLEGQGKGVTCDQVNHTQIIIDACTAIGFFRSKDFGTQQAADQLGKVSHVTVSGALEGSGKRCHM